jgi:hypothetical protein
MTIGSRTRVIFRACKRPQCWYYRCERFMTYAVELDSGDIIYVSKNFQDDRLTHLSSITVTAII